MSTIKVDSIKSADGNTDLLTLSNGAVSGVNLGRRNLIINGAMQVAQRGTSSTISGYGTVDRFRVIDSTSTLSITQSQETTAPDTFSNSVKVVLGATGSLSGSDRCMVDTAIEGINLQHLGWGTSSAKSLTLSFWVRSNNTGTFGGSFRHWNSSNITYSLPFTYTINAANTWEYKTITVEGNTSADIRNTNDSGISITFGIAVASNFSASNTSWTAANYLSHTSASLHQTSGDNLYITGVQLELGSVATPFEHRSFGEELALCQRYYWRGNLEGAGYGFVYGTTGSYPYGGGITFPTQMRAQPTCAIVTAPTTVNCSVSNNQLLENVHGFIQQLVPASNGMCRANLGVYEADAEL